MSEHKKHHEKPAVADAPPEGAPAAAARDGAELSKVREELQAVRADLEARDKRLDEIARAYSSLLNDQKEFRARVEREKARVLEAERGKIVLHLLQVSDEIERALGAASDDKGPLADGVRLIHEGLRKTLSGLGLERLSLVGETYDPNLAEAVAVVPTDDAAADGKVLAELVPGYRLGERILRPARVRVSRHVPAAARQAGSPTEGPLQ